MELRFPTAKAGITGSVYIPPTVSEDLVNNRKQHVIFVNFQLTRWKQTSAEFWLLDVHMHVSLLIGPLGSGVLDNLW